MRSFQLLALSIFKVFLVFKFRLNYFFTIFTIRLERIGCVMIKHRLALGIEPGTPNLDEVDGISTKAVHRTMWDGGRGSTASWSHGRPACSHFQQILVSLGSHLLVVSIHASPSHSLDYSSSLASSASLPVRCVSLFEVQYCCGINSQPWKKLQ